LKPIYLFFCLIVFGSLLACKKNNLEPVPGGTVLLFDTIPVVKSINSNIAEGSGIADSKINPGYIWVQEDGGNPSELSLIGTNGVTIKKIYVKNALNRDWEDMALVGNDLYIADIGDNLQVYPDYSIYRIPEPLAAADTASSIEVIKFKYPDGPHDAEAILIDSASKDIFIITKRINPANIYKISFPYASLNTAILTGTLPYWGITGAALSLNGREIIVRTYFNLYYYTRAGGESIDQALKKGYTNLPFYAEPQGEAITFANDNTGFFTLSEKGTTAVANLYYYKRH
jgi:hypothetical protein